MKFKSDKFKGINRENFHTEKMENVISPKKYFLF